MKKATILANDGNLKEITLPLDDFPLDNATYNALMDDTVLEDQRPFYFALYYYDYVKERRFQRKEIPFSSF